MDISKRNSALDITRITALFCVISVHFFLNSGFYGQPMFGKRMFVMTVMRSAFMICVPLFIMLTGYLMNRKTLSGKYYGGIVKTLGIYLLASVACMVYKVAVLHREITADLTFWGVFNYSTADYSWYIEMYIGLFLLIPFLNAMYGGLKSQKEKLALIITLICLTSLPNMVNIFNFDVADWWKTPYLSTEYRQFLPDWWTRLYPLTYYFLGAYLREFPLKLRQFVKLIILGGCIIAFGSFNFYRSRYGFFAWSQYNDWQGLPNVIMTLFAFSFLSSIKTDKYPKLLKRLLMSLSDLCLGAYLVSSIFDSYFYTALKSHEPLMTHRLEYFVLIVPAVFICSLALSFVMNTVYRCVEIGCTSLLRRLKRNSTKLSLPSKTNNQPMFETERLILRPFRVEDASDMYAYACDPDVGPMAGWKPHESPEESKTIIQSFIEIGDVWAIESKETQRVIGSVGLHRTGRAGYTYDLELGYVMAKSEWGKGFTPEAAGCIIGFAFRLGVETLLVSHFDGNVQSQRVIEKLGFKPAGHIDNSFSRFDGASLGENIYMLGADDYIKTKKNSAEIPSDLKLL